MNDNNRRFTEEDIAEVIEGVSLGLTYRAAAAVVGMTEMEFSNRMKRDDEFADQILKAEGRAQRSVADAIRQGFTDHPKLALDYARSRFPADYSPRVEVRKLSIKATGTFTVADLHMLQQARHEQDLIDAGEAEVLT